MTETEAAVVRGAAAHLPEAAHLRATCGKAGGPLAAGRHALPASATVAADREAAPR